MKAIRTLLVASYIALLAFLMSSCYQPPYGYDAKKAMIKTSKAHTKCPPGQRIR